MIRIAALTILGVYLTLLTYAQTWQHMINEGANYHDIVAEAKRYFANEGTDDTRSMKAFMRWEGQMSYMVGKDGVIRNFSAMKMRALEQVERQWPADTRSTHGTWSEIGPFAYTQAATSTQGGVGRISRLTIDPSNSNNLWVGSPAGGLWKSSDTGSTWTNYSSGLGPSGCSGVVIHPSNPNIMYMLTGDGERLYTNSVGVLKSTDGGQTWFPTAFMFDYSEQQRLYDIVMDPSDPETMFVCGIGGIWKTTDSWETHTKVSNFWAFDLEFAPAPTYFMYAGGSNYVLRSNTSGNIWTQTFVTGNSTRVELSVSPASPGTVFALFGGGSMGFDGLYKSDSYGSEDSFELLSNSPNILSNSINGAGTQNQVNSGNIAMIVDPADTSIIYAAGINLWKSIDGGRNWTRKTHWDDVVPPYVHADFFELYISGSNLYAVNDGGLYRSSDGADTWSDLTSGMSLTTFYEIDVVSDSYIGGTQDNGTFRNSVYSTLGIHILGGDGFGAAYHPNPTIMFASSQNGLHRIEGSDNDIISPFGLGHGDFWNTEIEMHTTNPDYVFATSRKRLFRGTGDSTAYTWDSLHTGPILTHHIRDYAQGTNDPERMYVTTQSLVIRTDNLGTDPPTWTPLNITFISPAQPSDVAVDSDDADRVWVAFSGFEEGEKVYYSWNGGSNWQNISGSLPNIPIHSITYQPGSNDGIYVGTSLGVFYRNADLSDWIYFSNGLPPIQVNDLDFDVTYLYAGTFGRGIWRSPLYSACPYSLTLTPSNDPTTPQTVGIQVYHASHHITTTRLIQGGFGTDVTYNAGDYIDLTPGFWAKTGSFMESRVEGCPD